MHVRGPSPVRLVFESGPGADDPHRDIDGRPISLRGEGSHRRSGAVCHKPYEMKRGVPFGIAGIWERWKHPKTGATVRTFCVTTIRAICCLNSIEYLRCAATGSSSVLPRGVPFNRGQLRAPFLLLSASIDFRV